MRESQGTKAPSAQNKREYKIFLSRSKVKLLFHGINHLLNEMRIFQPFVLWHPGRAPLKTDVENFPFYLQGIPIKCLRVSNTQGAQFFKKNTPLQDPNRTFGQKPAGRPSSSRLGISSLLHILISNNSADPLHGHFFSILY